MVLIFFAGCGIMGAVKGRLDRPVGVRLPGFGNGRGAYFLCLGFFRGFGAGDVLDALKDLFCRVAVRLQPISKAGDQGLSSFPAVAPVSNCTCFPLARYWVSSRASPGLRSCRAGIRLSRFIQVDTLPCFAVPES